MADTNAIIENLKKTFNAEAAKGMEEVFQFNIEDGDDYHIIIRDKTCDVLTGEHDDPSVTLILDKKTLKSLLKGDEKGMQVFMTGRLRAEGDLLLATKLSQLFPAG